MTSIKPRSAWGARQPKGVHRIARTPRLWLHHTVTAEAPSAKVIKQIQNYHMDSKGWKDIAYSFLVDVGGQSWEGRGALVAGGHTAGDNTSSHAICAVGNFDANMPPAAMIEGIAQLVAHGYRSGWWTTKTITGGHREAPGASTACPGRHLFAMIPAINKRALEIIGSPTTPVAPTPGPPPPSKPTTPKPGAITVDEATKIRALVAKNYDEMKNRDAILFESMKKTNAEVKSIRTKLDVVTQWAIDQNKSVLKEIASLKAGVKILTQWTKDQLKALKK